MKLPKGDLAIVEIEKLRRYCLDPTHPRGRHKARVFQAALGMSVADAATLQDALVSGAAREEASAGQSDAYGTRYTFDMQLRYGAKSAVIRCHWIVRRYEDVPRLVTCYVK